MGTSKKSDTGESAESFLEYFSSFLRVAGLRARNFVSSDENLLAARPHRMMRGTLKKP